MAKKKPVNDNIIDTGDGMIEENEKELWKKNPLEALRYDQIEARKKMNWWARIVLSLMIVSTFLFLIGLLFFAALPQESRDLVNILIGAYVAVLAKSTDYWFKNEADVEQKESEALVNNNNNNNTEII